MERFQGVQEQVGKDSLVSRVLVGQKPGAYIDRSYVFFQSGDILSSDGTRLKTITRIAEEFRSLGLEAIPVASHYNGYLHLPESVVIAKPRRASEVFGEVGIPKIAEIGGRIDQLADMFKGKSVAEALAIIYQSPRIWTEQFGSYIESPEATVLEGLLLGYQPCCVKYFVETRRLGKARDNLSESIIIPGPDTYIKCPACIDEYLKVNRQITNPVELRR